MLTARLGEGFFLFVELFVATAALDVVGVDDFRFVVRRFGFETEFPSVKIHKNDNYVQAEGYNHDHDRCLLTLFRS